MERKLPAQYQGWQEHAPALRRLSTAELISEVQDGPPDRRLAALSVIDLGEVPQAQIEDWIRVLPDAEVNQLAAAIPAGRRSCDDDVRWLDLARLAFDRRRLPTFLVILFSTLESMEQRQCPNASNEWERTGEWLGGVYDRLAEAHDEQALDDLSLFVFENHLDRDQVFESFCAAIRRHPDLARQVSANPSFLLSSLPEAKQRQALLDAEVGGGLPFDQSWAALKTY